MMKWPNIGTWTADLMAFKIISRHLETNYLCAKNAIVANRSALLLVCYPHVSHFFASLKSFFTCVTFSRGLEHNFRSMYTSKLFKIDRDLYAELVSVTFFFQKCNIVKQVPNSLLLCAKSGYPITQVDLRLQLADGGSLHSSICIILFIQRNNINKHFLERDDECFCKRSLVFFRVWIQRVHHFLSKLTM